MVATRARIVGSITAGTVVGALLVALPAAAASAEPDDPSIRVTDDGRIYYVDPVRPGTPTRATAPRSRAQAPLEDTFELHSRPGSLRTIYLDFDGTEVSGTTWNEDEGLPDRFYAGWDPADDGPDFTASERVLVQEIWQIAAEDFATFDVDVTTEDPGLAAIDRSGPGDQVYGTRVLLSGDQEADELLQTFGIAAFDVFDATEDHEYHQPAWVFPGPYSTKAIADTVSHEVGHNLALDHDGKGGEEYYEGHGIWGPIMGTSDYRPVAQWSNGDYGGTNDEDDLAIIARSGAPLLDDEAGSTPAGAAAFPSGPAYITHRDDQDVFALGQCEDTVTLEATPGELSPNLDIELELLSAGGTVLSSDNPASAGVDEVTATGMGAGISGSLGSPATLYARVDGVGRGNPATSYSDYGSVGSYHLSATGCDLAAPPDVALEQPGRPKITEVKPGRPGGKKSAVVRWRPPSNASAAEVEGYQLRAYLVRNRRVVRTITSDIYPADQRRAVFSKRTQQRFKFAVRAVNEDGHGRWSKKSKTVRLR